MDAILHENAVAVCEAVIAKRGLPSKEIFAAFADRTAETTYIPKDIFNFDSEIGILPRVVFIINWKKEVAIEIRDEATIGLLLEMFRFAKEFGRKVDQNELIRRRL